MKRLTAKGIEKHLFSSYGECRHNPQAMYAAAKETAKETGIAAIDIFHFVIGESSPAGLKSYGFHTAAGRYVVEYFQYQYDKTI